MGRTTALAATALAAFTLAASADAQPRGRWTQPTYGYGYGPSAAFDNGYREGFEQGADDVRDGRPFAYTRDKAYRKSDQGYRREYGDRGDYKRVFRDGYVSGYTDAYNGTGRFGAPRAVPRGGQYPRGGYGYPPGSNYPRGYPGRGGVYELAAQNGFEDGYEKGLEDGRDRDRFDPTRHGRYRSADRGWNNRYGNKEEYRYAYREGFRSGYERGYYESHR